MPTAPLVSIIIPAHNAASTFRKALESLLAQDEPSFEAIIVDDASSDSIQDEIKDISDPRIKYLRNATTLGPHASVNIGWQQARGKYVCCLDADDELTTPTSLSLRIAALEANDWDAVHTGISVNRHQESEEVLTYYLSPVNSDDSDIIKDFLLHGSHNSGININTFMYRTTVFNKIGYRSLAEYLFPHNDYEFVLRIFSQCRVGWIDQSTYIYNIKHTGHSARYSNNKSAKIHQLLLRSHYVKNTATPLL